MKENFEIIKTDSEEAGLEQYISLLWSKKGFIIAFVLLGSLIGLLVGQSIQPTYSAEALIQVESKKSGFSLSGEFADLMSNESETVTEIGILKSRMVLGQAVDANELTLSAEPRRLPVIGYLLSKYSVPHPELDWLSAYGWNDETIRLRDVKVAGNQTGQTITITKESGVHFDVKMPDGRVRPGSIGEPFYDIESGVEFTVSELSGQKGREYFIHMDSKQAAIGRLRGALTVSESPRNSGLVRVALSSPDRNLAQQSLTGILDAYVAQNIGRSAAEATRSFEFLMEQLPLVKEELGLAEAELNEYRLKSDSIDINLETASVLDQIVALDAQLSELALEETQLSRLYTPNHPEYAALLKMRTQLTSKRAAISNTVKALPERQQEVLRKNRDVEVSQQIYLQLLNKAQELDVLKAGAVGTVRVVDTAAALPGPVSPKPFLIFALATVAAGTLAGLFVIMRSAMAREIDSPADLEKQGVPVFATIPHSMAQDKITRSKYRRGASLLSHEAPTEMAVEALRNLRTSLHFGMLDKTNGVVAITGPSPEVGKSFVTLNLGYLAAQAGARVLIVDADLRRGTIGKAFDLERSTEGLSDVLSGHTSIESAIHRVEVNSVGDVTSAPDEDICRDWTVSFNQNGATQNSRGKPLSLAVGDTVLEIPTELTLQLDVSDRGNVETHARLDIVPRGKAPPNPSELLMHIRFSEFISQMSEQYDLVLLDTPPVLAATDALIASKYADMSLVVVCHGKTRITEYQQVLKMFQQNQSSVTGVVLNNYDPKNGRYGAYGETYGYQYDYR